MLPKPGMPIRRPGFSLAPVSNLMVTAAARWFATECRMSFLCVDWFAAHGQVRTVVRRESSDEWLVFRPWFGDLERSEPGGQLGKC